MTIGIYDKIKPMLFEGKKNEVYHKTYTHVNQNTNEKQRSVSDHRSVGYTLHLLSNFLSTKQIIKKMYLLGGY